MAYPTTRFQIVCAPHPNLAIQAGASGGQDITLQEGDPTQKAQLWEIALQQAKDGWYGLAFVNTLDGQPRAIAAHGSDTPLVMQDFRFSSAFDDAWALTAQGDQRFCIGLTRHVSWRFGAHRAPWETDQGAGGVVGTVRARWMSCGRAPYRRKLNRPERRQAGRSIGAGREPRWS